MASSAVNSAIDKLLNLQLNELSASSSPNLQKNLSILSPQQVLFIKISPLCVFNNVRWCWFKFLYLYVQIELGKMLLELGQGHLFEHWPDPGVDDDDKRSVLDQVIVTFILHLIIMLLGF